ncbi:helix-turn-helix domain-containing protein [Streptomyces cyaneofuscatus]|uniref:helix-turn-helix domain-containing protein n=1 Tax=Streptomyces cyaneofuscatus TaxID=66883 RepID=UPI0036D9B297
MSTTISQLPREAPEFGHGYWPFETRAELVADLVESYHAGASIRELVASRGICFGTVQNLLREGEAVMRPRGDTRRPNRD